MKRFYYFLVFSFSFILTYAQEDSKEISHYLFSDFTQGIVLMKNGTENKALLNYNSLTEEMVFKDKGKMLAIGKPQLPEIDTVFIRNRKFFTLNGKFVELILHSTSDLYAEHKCKLIPPGKPAGYGGTSETSAVSSYSSLSSGGRVYDLKLPDDYKIEPYIYYWLKRNGELSKFSSIKQLMKLYDNKAELCKTYTKKYNVKYNDQESIVQFIKYLETN
jgi:hypothetical protein